VRRLTLVALLLSASCSDFPHDPEGTLDRVRADGAFRVGIVARGAPVTAQEQLFLQQVARAANARPQIEHAASESLLARLEEGELDLVLGEFDAASPWLKRVTFIPPLSARSAEGDAAIVSAVARNGENAWIRLLHAEKAVLESAR